MHADKRSDPALGQLAALAFFAATSLNPGNKLAQCASLITSCRLLRLGLSLDKSA